MKSFSRSRGAASAHSPGRIRLLRRNVALGSLVAVAATVSLSVSALADTATDLPTSSSAYNSAWQSAPNGYTVSNDGLGVTPGKIGHVWVIVLENHAYSQSFTPLEGTQSSYLQQLPSQGALLTHYYGTGHSSLDNYLSIVSGQAPQADDQSDCNNYSAMDGSIDTSGSPATNADYGQLQSNAGPDAPPGDNGCVYPSSVKTIFNQLDTAGDTWKEYAQDLDGGTPISGGTSLVAPHANQDAGYTPGSAENTAVCGAPDTGIAKAPDQAGSYGSPATGAGTDANVNFASTNGISGIGTVDSYVAKHNPLPWFSSLTGTANVTGTDSGGTLSAMNSSECSGHLATLFGPNDQLYNDLQNASTTPDLSFISPDNCSDGHDAICSGNNLTGGTSNGYTNGTIAAASNDTGGTVAESSFLKIVVPEIEASPAFKQNGMIVVTYDEAYPPFSYSGDSQASSQLQSADATGSLTNDAAGETLYGRSLNWEPTGPNTTIVKSNLSGQVLSGGPGDSAYLDLPNTTSAAPDAAVGDLVNCNVVDNFVGGFQPFTTPTPTNGSCVPGYQANGYHPTSPAAIHLDVASGATVGTTAETESSVSEVDAGAEVSTVGGTAVSGSVSTYFTLPADGNNGNVYLGQITNAPNAGDSTTATSVSDSTVSFVDNLGNPVTAVGATVGTQVAIGLTQSNTDSSNDPFFDPYDATMGGGDAGAIVISPDVTPGTVSNNYYNHYSLLRTIEDIFGEQSNGSNTLTGGIVSGSTSTAASADTSGPYLGFAAQPGLAPFGTDVFGPTSITNTNTVTVTKSTTVTAPGTTSTQTVTTGGGSTTVTVRGLTRTVTKTNAIVPNVAGDTEAAAKKAITTDGLKVGTIKGKGTEVASTSPKAGKKVAAHSKVQITLKAKK